MSPDSWSGDLPTVVQAAYPAGIRVGGYLGLKGGFPYFNSTILMDLGKPGSDNLRRWMREELAGHPPLSPASAMLSGRWLLPNSAGWVLLWSRMNLLIN